MQKKYRKKCLLRRYLAMEVSENKLYIALCAARTYVAEGHTDVEVTVRETEAVTARAEEAEAGGGVDVPDVGLERRAQLLTVPVLARRRRKVGRHLRERK